MSSSEKVFHEYAFERELLSDWENFDDEKRALLHVIGDHFGFQKGRLVSRFPESWIENLSNSIGSYNLKDLDRQLIIEFLNYLKIDFSVSVPRKWEDGKTWFENIKESHRKNGFRAIIVKDNPRRYKKGLIAKELLGFRAFDKNKYLKNSLDSDVSRSADTIADSIDLLLQDDPVIQVIEPHFAPDKDRFTNTLKQFAVTAIKARRGKMPIFKYHVQHCIDGGSIGGSRSSIRQMSSEDYEKLCKKNLPHKIPRGVKVEFYRWTELKWLDTDLDRYDSIHDRFIITRRGGVSMGHGTDEEPEASGATSDVLIQILSDRKVEKLWRMFDPDTKSFKPNSKIMIEGKLGSG